MPIAFLSEACGVVGELVCAELLGGGENALANAVAAPTSASCIDSCFCRLGRGAPRIIGTLGGLSKSSWVPLIAQRRNWGVLYASSCFSFSCLYVETSSASQVLLLSSVSYFQYCHLSLKSFLQRSW